MLDIWLGSVCTFNKLVQTVPIAEIKQINPLKYFKIILSGFFYFTLPLSISSVLILVGYHFRQLAKIPFFLIYENFYRRFEFFDNNRCWFRYQQSKFRVYYSNEEGWRLKTININKSKHISTF